MTYNFPDDEAEFSRCWSSDAGGLSAINRAIIEVERRSAEAYVRRRDSVADSLRDAATQLGIWRDELSKKLSAYIEENKKREYERRPQH